jgi:formate dehydrogenase subunit gamma
MRMSSHAPWSAERAIEIIAGHKARKGATLVILHALQETFGHVPEPAIPMVAEALNLRSCATPSRK